MGSDPASFPVAITGMHRSGTSMVTRALHDSGLQLVGTGAESLIEAADDNPEGFWENKAIVSCNDDLLEAAGGSWDNPPEVLPQAVDDPRVGHVAERATAALAALSEHDHWGFKDPRLCLTAGYWLDLEPDLRFVVCVRHPLEVALSLKRRNQNSYSLGLALWERYYASVLALVPSERRLVTHYDTFFVDPDGELARLAAFSGLDASSPRVLAELRHHTIGASLEEAGASASLRALYADLCREAGVALPPEPAADQGRVRRLILDGAVAARHAEQRQAAIDRLEEREREFRDEHQAAQAELRDRIRMLEQEKAASETRHRERLRAAELEKSRLETRHREQLRAAEARVSNAIAAVRSLQEAVQRVDTRTATMKRELDIAVQGGPVERITRRSLRKGARTARALFRRRSHASVEVPVASAKQAGASSSRARVRVALTDPARALRAVRRRVEPPARGAARRLPPSTQDTLRRGRARVRRAKAAPVPTARRAARRLPPPAQRAARKAWRITLRVGGERVSRLGRTVEAPRPAPTPRGPAARQWRDAYARLVLANVPEGATWLAIVPGSSTDVCTVGRLTATPFPATKKNRPMPDDLAHIAHLEAQRARGHRFLVLPEGSRAWFRQQAELRDHVTRSYRTVVDEPGAGAVFDLTTPTEVGPGSLRAEVARVESALGRAPAVLAWTPLDVAAELPGIATFRPPAGARLPYLDRSVDVVVVDAAVDAAEAGRVAAHAVVTVAPGESGIRVIAREEQENDDEPVRPRVVVWASAAPDDEAWALLLRERTEAAGAVLHLTGVDAARLPPTDEHDVVVVVEPHVLPLPGAIEAAAAAIGDRADRIVAGKVLRPDGRIDAAGGTVFFDRSIAAVAAGSPDVRGAWHEYVRPVCWAPGLLAAPGALFARVPLPEAGSGRALLREWCASVWAHGGSVMYHPTVAAVRVAGDGGEPAAPLEASAWQRVLDHRPRRPDILSDGEWRFLLATDDVEACRG